GPHGGGGPHGTPLRLGTRSSHWRRVPRGAPLHGGRQRQIRGSVPAWCSRTGSSNPSPSSGGTTNFRFRNVSSRGCRRFTVGGSGKSVARCHRTVLGYWKFESISLQRRVGANFQFLSGGLNRSVPVGRAAHGDIRGDISVPRSYVNGTSRVQ